MLDQGAAAGLDHVQGRRLFEIDAKVGGDDRTQRRDLTLWQPGDREHEVDEGGADGGAPEGVESPADLRVLELAEVAVHMEQKIVEVLVRSA